MKANSITLAVMMLLGGCSESHAVPDAALPDVGVECGFATDGECPAGCHGFSGVRTDEIPTECPDITAGHYVWCSGSNLASFAYSCFELPSGGFITMSAIPAEFLTLEGRCDPNPWSLCAGP